MKNFQTKFKMKTVAGQDPITKRFSNYLVNSKTHVSPRPCGQVVPLIKTVSDSKIWIQKYGRIYQQN